MIRFGVFLGLLTVFCLTSCSETTEDITPPLPYQTPKTPVSVFDTITVSFTEEIVSFDSSNYSCNYQLECSLSTSNHSVIQCWPDSLGSSAQPQLHSNSKYTITFTGLEDKAGNIAPDTAVTIAIATMVDNDFIINSQPANNNFLAAENLSKTVAINSDNGGTPDTVITGELINSNHIDSGITLSGFLGETNTTAQLYDTQDFYTIGLRAKDTIQITISQITSPIKLQILSPETRVELQKIDIYSEGTLTFAVETEKHSDLTSDLAERLAYFIKILIIDTENELFTNYSINIKRIGCNDKWGCVD